MSSCRPDFVPVRLDVSSPETQPSLLPGRTHNRPAAAPTEQQMPAITQKPK